MKKAFIAVGAMVALAATAEVGARVGFGLGSPIVFSLDKLCGYLPSPDQDTHRFGSHIKINHAGMRSEDFSDRKQHDEHRILFVGDSVTFGPTFVDQSKIFPELIPGALAEAGLGHWKSLNASAPGWGTGNELGFLQSRGTFGAEVVVLVINTGDLDQPFNQCNGSNCPTQRPPSALGEALQRYIFPRLGLAPRAASDSGSTGVTSGAIPVENVIANIARFRDIVTGNGGRFILAYVPARGGNWDAPHWQMEKRAVAQFASEHQVEFLDLSEAVGSQPVSEIYFDGVHLRPAGHALVAQELQHTIETVFAASRSDDDQPRVAGEVAAIHAACGSPAAAISGPRCQ